MPDTSPDQHEERNNRARVVLAIVVALLILLLMALGYFFVRVLTPLRGPAAGEQTGDGLVWVRSMYGFGPSEIEQLLDPTSVACAPDGRVYVTDPQRSRIMIFNADGTFDSLLHTGAGGTKEREFVRPESIDIDDDGNVFIADSWARKIIVFDAQGAYVREWTLPDEFTARGVYVSGDEVYVLTGGTVRLYTRQGRELGEFGTRGRDVGQLDAYQGVAAIGDGVYVADALNTRMQAFTRQGESLWVYPVSFDQRPADQKKDIYELPQDLTIDGNGRLVTIDAFAFQIIVSDPKNGEVLGRYGTDGGAEGEFFYPTGIDYDAERDWFAVADTRNNRVQIVRIPDSGGDAMSSLQGLLSSPYRYCMLPLGLLLLAFIIGVFAARRRREAVEDETDILPEELSAAGESDSGVDALADDEDGV